MTSDTNKWQTTRTALLTVAASAAIAVGCGGGKQGGVEVGTKQGGGDGTEAQLEGGQQTGTGTGTAQNPITPGASLLKATYDLNATALGISMCKGDVTIKINAAIEQGGSASLFEIPQGKIKCAIMGEIDLTQVLGSVAQPGMVQPDPNGNMVVENDVIHLKQIGMGTFTPPRPLLPSFLAASRAHLAALNYSRQVSVTAVKEGGGTESGSGTVSLNMISFGQPAKPPRMQRTFPDVMYVKILNTGFDGVNKIGSALFDEMTFKISLKPLAVVQFTFRGKIADYAASMPAGGAGGGSNPLGGMMGGGGGLGGGGILGMIVGAATKLIDVNLTADLVSQEGFVDSATATDTGGGVTIGGEDLGGG